jgi:hypothetical protein
MRSSNPSFKKKIFTFRFFEEIPKKFSSLHLFFLLFGFFLGNLSPQGFFFQSVPFLFPFRGDSVTDESLWFEKGVRSQAPLGKQEAIPLVQDSIERTKELNQFSQTNKNWSLIGIFNSFPGPAPTILLWSEIFNWLSFRVFPFQKGNEKNFPLSFFQKKRKKNEKSFFLGLEKRLSPQKKVFSPKEALPVRERSSRTNNQTFSEESKEINKKNKEQENAELNRVNFHFFLRSFNSMKIGFLLGIFVDAFKVGS